MSSSGSRPATCIIRSAMISVPEFGAPTETVLPFEVLDRLDARVGLRDDLGDVRVDRPERAQRLLARERLVAAHGVDRGVAERERDVGVAAGDQQQVVDRGRGRLGGRRRVGQLVGQDLGEPAAVDLVDAAGAARGDREPPSPPADRWASTRRSRRRSLPPRQPRPTRSPPPMRASSPPAPGAETTSVAACSSRERFSASCSAAVISSSSPASSASRLWTVSFDAVVGHAPLGEVVGPDLLRALAGADLGAPVGGQLGLLLGDLGLVEPRAQDLERALAVLQLRLLVLHRDDDAGRLVRDADGRVGRVDRLPARARGAVDVDLRGRSGRSRRRRPPPRAAPRRWPSRCGCAPGTRSPGRAARGACRPRT